MALLIYSNGMDVRVATIPNDHALWYKTNNPAEYATPVQWEYCGDDADYRKRCQELEKDNQHLQKVANDMVAQKLILENQLHKLREDNLEMHTKISKAYKVLE